jgi:hypothetical protein
MAAPTGPWPSILEPRGYIAMPAPVGKRSGRLTVMEAMERSLAHPVDEPPASRGVQERFLASLGPRALERKGSPRLRLAAASAPPTLLGPAGSPSFPHRLRGPNPPCRSGVRCLGTWCCKCLGAVAPACALSPAPCMASFTRESMAAFGLPMRCRPWLERAVGSDPLRPRLDGLLGCRCCYGLVTLRCCDELGRRAPDGG